MKKSRILVAVLTLSVAALSVASVGAGDTEKPKKKAKTVKLTVTDLPPAVLATLQAQVGDGTIVEVKQKTKKGLVVFHADVMTKGKDWEIDVLADGTLPIKGGKKSLNKGQNTPGKEPVNQGGDVPGKPCADDCIYAQGKPCPDDCIYAQGKACAADCGDGVAAVENPR
jgi:hypothetical protein